MYEFRKPTKADAIYIAGHLKRDNIMELEAMGDTALNDILHGMECSNEIGCCIYDGIPIAIYGIIRDSVLSDTGHIWLLLTDKTERHKVFIGKRIKTALRAIMEKYEVLHNWVPASCREIIRWLRWMGAIMYGPYPYGIYNRPHYYFEIRKDDSLWD